jgi:penicillin-binding protein 2B
MYSEIEEKNSSLEQFTLSNYVSTTSIATKNELDKHKMNVIFIGTGDKIINQSPVSGTKVVTGDKVFLVTNNKNIKMPNMIGWSRSDVITYCNLANLEYKITGYGYVTTQSIKLGTAIDKNQAIEVVLANKEIKTNTSNTSNSNSTSKKKGT